MKRYLLFLLALVPAALFLSACADDEVTCSPECASGFTCEQNAAGEAVCLPVCGTTACQSNETCQDGECVVAQVECTGDDRPVGGVCVPPYTADNVCDPLRTCRNECGTSAACLAACDEDRSDTCSTCQDTLAACETSNSCSSGGYEEGCCFTEFCSCFPSHPNCGNVPPCEECADECGDDVTCFSNCAQDEPACNLCLQENADDRGICITG